MSLVAEAVVGSVFVGSVFVGSAFIGSVLRSSASRILVRAVDSLFGIECGLVDFVARIEFAPHPPLWLSGSCGCVPRRRDSGHECEALLWAVCDLVGVSVEPSNRPGISWLRGGARAMIVVVDVCRLL